MNVEGTVVVSVTETMEESAIEDVKNEEIAMEEENNEKDVIGGEENESEEEDDAIVEAENDENMVVEAGNEYATEEAGNDENAIVEAGNEGATEEARNDENAIEGEDRMKDEKNEESVKPSTEEKINKSKKRNRRRRAGKGGSGAVVSNTKDKLDLSAKKKALKKTDSEAVAAKDKDKPESSSKKKSSKKVESMGMIFMCSSKTKKDCFRYKVLGLPASKKDIVQKIYKGMRLFLFDFDLRLLYGIYKAAGPGGYNIEPTAFKSAFPSQVRFTIMEDCLPLAEEKFKKVIKENYFSRNKFDCQLNSIQVKNLCKLFASAGKGSKLKKSGESRRAEIPAPVDRHRSRRRALDEDRRISDRRYLDEERRSARGGDRRYLDEERRSARGGDRRYMDEERRSGLSGDHRYHERPVIYERTAYASPVAPLPRFAALPQPAPAPTYTYERTPEMDAYRRDQLYEQHERRFLDLERRRRDEIEIRDPYVSYREPAVYREPLYSSGLPVEYRSSALSSEYRHAHAVQTGIASEYRPSVLASEYRRVGAPQPDYRSAAVLPPEYSQPLYRY